VFAKAPFNQTEESREDFWGRVKEGRRELEEEVRERKREAEANILNSISIPLFEGRPNVKTSDFVGALDVGTGLHNVLWTLKHWREQ